MVDYLIDRVLPAREVSLVTGRSGAGKTRWLLSMLMDWQRGIPVLGHVSFPVPWVYVSVERSRESITRNFQEMGIDIDKINVLGLEDIDGRPDAKEVLRKARIAYPNAKLWVLEAFSFLLPVGTDFNNGHGVFRFLRDLVMWCKEEDMTIVGLTHTAKPQQGSVKRGRETVIGSVAWGVVAETIFHIEDSARGQDFRQLLIYNHNGPHETHELHFDTLGRLVETDAPRPLEELLDRLDLDAVSSSPQVVKKLAQESGVHVTTVYRRLRRLKDRRERGSA